MSETTQAPLVETLATVMIVEDDALVAMDLAMQVEDLGYSVMGPFHDMTSALAQLEQALPDGAILDYNLGTDETSKPLLNEP